MKPEPFMANAVRRAVRRLFRHETALILILAGVLTTAGVLDPAFLAWQTQIKISSHVWELALLALPMMLIIIAGGIDLSVGSIMALAAVVLGLGFEKGGLSIWAAALAAVAAGGAAGACNGLLTARYRLHPLIVTLATLAAFRGVAEGISLGRPFSGFPDTFILLGRGTFLGLPIPGLVVAAATVGTGVLLARTTFGRSLFAIGHNETACRFSGVRVDRTRFLLHTAAGLAAGLAAVLYAARRNTAKADVGLGMELDVITAVVLGGTSIFGGRGTLFGTIAGVVVIHEVREFTGWHWDRDELVFIAVGALLILSVLLRKALDAAQHAKALRH